MQYDLDTRMDIIKQNLLLENPDHRYIMFYIPQQAKKLEKDVLKK